MTVPVASRVESAHRSVAGTAALRRILVVVDPTAGGSQAVVDKAARIATTCGASLELYICDVVQDIPEGWAGSARLSEYRAMRRQRFLAELNAMAAQVGRGGLAVSVACEWHAPLEEGIGHHVIRTRPDLVVKGTSRHAEASRVTLTRTDWNLVRQIPASLLLVGSQPWQPQPRIAVAVDPGSGVEHPVHMDEALADEARELASILRAQLEIYHVLQNPPHLPGETVSAEHKEDAHTHARLCTTRLARRVQAAGVRVEEGRLIEGLVRMVSAHRPDILVMGAVARPRWVHSAASGTAAQILERIACDLLVVKPPGFVSPLLVTED